jgi:hypothetical protein
LHNQWECICSEILNTSQNEGGDTWEWRKGKNGRFSVKSMYDQLSGVGIGRKFTHIWKAKIHIKLRFLYG